MKNISIKPFTKEYLPLYYQWAEKDHVKGIWFKDGYEPVNSIESKIVGNGYDYPFIILAGGHPIGYIVYSDLYAYRTIHPYPVGTLKDEPQGSVSVDLFIGDENYLDQGYGTQAMQTFCEMLLQKPGINRLVIDPNSDNKRAIRCYEKTGFRFFKEARDVHGTSHVMEKHKYPIKGEHQIHPDFALDVNPDTMMRLPRLEESAALFNLIDENRQHLRKFLGWVDSTKEIKDTEDFIRSSIASSLLLKGLYLIIVYRNQPIGILDLHLIDFMNRQSSIGYWIDQGHQGKGIMTKCVERLIRYAFEQLKLHRLEIRCAVENTRSQNIPERLGFQKEGTLKSAIHHYGSYFDAHIYGLIGE